MSTWNASFISALSRCVASSISGHSERETNKGLFRRPKSLFTNKYDLPNAGRALLRHTSIILEGYNAEKWEEFSISSIFFGLITFSGKT